MPNTARSSHRMCPTPFPSRTTAREAGVKLSRDTSGTRGMPMRELRVKRIRFCREADTWLKVLKTRTGVTPNILCRLGFCLSLEEPGLPQVEQYPEDSQREINRYTLLGEYDLLFAC